VVRGYKLEQASTPIQKVPPRVIQAKNSHPITEEVEIVAPCHNQFLSRIFVVPK